MNPDIEISFPLPNVDIDETRLNELKSTFSRDGDRLLVKAIDPYPVSVSWVEIVIYAGTFLAGVGMNHYAGKIFTALDEVARKGITQFNACLKRGGKVEYVDITRENRDTAVKLISEALERLKQD